MFTLDSKITELYRVGQTTAKLLKKLGLSTVRDLLFYFPFRYDDFTATIKIAGLQNGANANIIGTVELIQNKRSAKRRMYLTEALISDETETLKVIWFNQPFLTRSLKVGDRISLAGRVSESYGQLAMISPQYEKIYSADLVNTKGLVPNYHTTSDLTQKQIRFLIKQIIPLADKTEDWLPAEIKKRLGLLDLNIALKKIHFPANRSEALEAQKRLGFTELFLRQLKAQLIKQTLKSRRAVKINFRREETQKFVASLPFKLTDDQRKAAWEILQDMEKQAPMSRLLEGDVGSGKTLVAVMAALNVALNKKQTAFMVPTEILARQHFNSLINLLAAFDLKIGLLTSGQKELYHQGKITKAPADILTKADIIIGTHALISDKINLPDLALTIVDEQHRFGVNQRKKILAPQNDLKIESKKINGNGGEKSGILTPHFLSMTATPIPRSLALAIYGDLDLSVINEKPSGRKEIITKIVVDNQRAAVNNFIRRQIKNGRQAFVVCPVIDESDKLGVKSVKREHAKLDKEIFPDLKVGLLHGQLKAKDKEAVMADFLGGKIQILVSTSVIEVGVDVPNATIMIIEGADRFGVSQLHQFRGRVGRGGEQSYCLLFPGNEESNNPKTIERLKALEKYADGFSLAKIDLKMRGAGELYGDNQSGFPELQIASLFDYENIKKAGEEAGALIKFDPELKRYPQLKQKLGEWENNAHLE